MSISAQQSKFQVITEEFAPYSYVKENKAIGKNVELVQLVLDELKIGSDIQFLPWARGYNIALKEPNTLIFSIARNKQREKLFHWVGSLAAVDVCIFSLKQKKVSRVKTLEQLKNYRTVTQRDGHISQQLTQHGFIDRKNLFSASSINHAIQMLYINRADFIGYPAEVLFYNLEQKGLTPDELLHTNFCIDSTALYLALSINTPQETVEQFKKALVKVKQATNWQMSEIHTPTY